MATGTVGLQGSYELCIHPDSGSYFELSPTTDIWPLTRLPVFLLCRTPASDLQEGLCCPLSPPTVLSATPQARAARQPG